MKIALEMYGCVACVLNCCLGLGESEMMAASTMACVRTLVAVILVVLIRTAVFVYLSVS